MGVGNIFARWGSQTRLMAGSPPLERRGRYACCRCGKRSDSLWERDGKRWCLHHYYEEYPNA